MASFDEGTAATRQSEYERSACTKDPLYFLKPFLKGWLGDGPVYTSAMMTNDFG
jgi:hypothetical protein